LKNKREVKKQGGVLIYNLIKTFPPIFHWAQLRPPGVGIEASAAEWATVLLNDLSNMYG